MDRAIEPPKPVKPGSVRAKLFSDLRKRAGVPTEESSTKPAAQPEKPKTPPTEAKSSPKPTEPAESTAPKPEATPETAKPQEKPGEKKPVNPWKLLDEAKASRAKLEQEVSELRRRIPKDEEVQATRQTMEQMTARVRELESELRFVDYSKSTEFREKYQQPYEQAWGRAMKNLGEIIVTDANGANRNVDPSDILELVNLPLMEARSRAVEKFGDFADDALAERKTIRNLWDVQNEALAKAKQESGKRDAERTSQWHSQMQALQSEISTLWQESNKLMIEHEKYGKHFRPVEGDEEGNAVLQKGFEIVDKALSVNPADPRLTPEQRAKAVKSHAAVRVRAAAFGRLTKQLASSEERIAALEKELAEYKSTTPDVNGKTSDNAAVPANVREQVKAAFRAKARPY